MVGSSDRLEVRFPRRATAWRLRTRLLAFDRMPRLMAIVNVTPDSFSDGGRFYAVDAAVDRALELAAQGADLLDIGGESTRPYSAPVPADEERRRTVPVIERLAARTTLPLSIDTSKADVAEQAIEAGAEVINDVTGLTGDARMTSVALRTRVGVCAMHMQGTPQTMQDDPRYDDVVRDVGDYLRQRRDVLVAAGIAPERLCLDPGIGFGKTHQHNLVLLARCGDYHGLGHPLLVGHSRKGFIGKVLNDKEADRTAGTVGVALALARQGIQVLRVHDIAPVHQALLLFAAAGGIDGQELILPS